MGDEQGDYQFNSDVESSPEVTKYQHPVPLMYFIELLTLMVAEYKKLKLAYTGKKEEEKILRYIVTHLNCNMVVVGSLADNTITVRSILDFSETYEKTISGERDSRPAYAFDVALQTFSGYFPMTALRMDQVGKLFSKLKYTRSFEI